MFKNFRLRQFTVKEVENFQSKKLLTHRPSTTNRVLACLKHMFTKAVEWEMVEQEVLDKIRKVKNVAENNKRLRFLSEEENSVGVKKDVSDRIDVIFDTHETEYSTTEPGAEMRYKLKGNQFLRLRLQDDRTIMGFERRREF